MRVRIGAHLVSGVAILLSLCGCPAHGPAGPPRHLVLITLDTTRQDRLSCYGYPHETSPHIDALARSGAVFRKAYAAAPITLPSHATIMTGTYPFYHGARDNGLYCLDEANTTLAERLRQAGFKTGAVVSAAVLRQRYGIDQGFDHYDAEVNTGFRPTGHVAERSATRVTDLCLEWLGEAIGASRRLFLWAHYFEPHAPWTAPAPYSEEFEQPYDAEIAYMDAEIGRLIAGIERLGILDQTLVVIVGDHGEGLGDHRELTHGMFLYEETVKVPLIITGGTVPGGVQIDEVVRTVDIVPTILDLLALPSDQILQGVSLRPALEGTARLELDAYFETYLPETTFGWSWLEGVRTSATGLKYIDAPRPEIYDLDSDPSESHDQYVVGGASARELARKLADIRGQRPPGGTPLSTPLTPSPEARRELASLGYLGGRVDRPAQRGPDPKDEYHLVLLKEQGAAKLNAGDYAGALETFSRLLDAVPRKGWAHELMATTLATQAQALIAAGRSEEGRVKMAEAVEHYQATVREKPEYVVGHYNLAMAYGQTGDVERQVAELEACTSLDATFLPAHYYLGLHAMDERDWPQAFDHLDRHWRSWRPRPGMQEHEGASSLLYSGVCLLHLGRGAEGEQRIARARELDPSLIEADFHLGKRAYQQGDRKRARGLLDRYARLASQAPQAPGARHLAEARRLLTKIREGR